MRLGVWFGIVHEVDVAFETLRDFLRDVTESV